MKKKKSRKNWASDREKRKKGRDIEMMMFNLLNCGKSLSQFYERFVLSFCVCQIVRSDSVLCFISLTTGTRARWSIKTDKRKRNERKKSIADKYGWNGARKYGFFLEMITSFARIVLTFAVVAAATAVSTSHFRFPFRSAIKFYNLEMEQGLIFLCVLFCVCLAAEELSLHCHCLRISVGDQVARHEHSFHRNSNCEPLDRNKKKIKLHSDQIVFEYLSIVLGGHEAVSQTEVVGGRVARPSNSKPFRSSFVRINSVLCKNNAWLNGMTKFRVVL